MDYITKIISDAFCGTDISYQYTLYLQNYIEKNHHTHCKKLLFCGFEMSVNISRTGISLAVHLV